MEDQHTEWKENWRNECMRKLWAFAKSDGDMLMVGVNGQEMPVDEANAKRLLEDLPNKVRDKLDIVLEIAIITQECKECVRIMVTTYPSLVSYNGVLLSQWKHCPRTQWQHVAEHVTGAS